MPMRTALMGPLATYKNLPDITFKADQAFTSSAPFNQDIIPPKGQIWVVQLASILLTAYASSASQKRKLFIGLYDGTTFSKIKGAEIKDTDTFKEGATGLTIGFSADGPILITNEKYLRLSAQSTDAQTGNQVDVVIVTRPL